MWLLYLMSWLVYIVGLVPLLGLTYGLWRWFRPTRPRPLLKPDWKQDVVYLCQFPLVPSVRTISPFALKLETWLRLTGIKYENVYTMRFSKKGQIPYIELNGEEIPDSNIIIERLKTHFKVDPDAQLDENSLALGHTALSMLENHTALTGFHFRYGYHMQEFLSVLQVEKYYPSADGVRWWGRVQPYLTRFRSYQNGMGRHENNDICEFARKDLKALSALVGEKTFFHGAVPTSVDCAIFGHLAQFLYIDIGFPQKAYMEKDYKNLVALVEAIKAKFWPDWNAIPIPAKKSKEE